MTSDLYATLDAAMLQLLGIRGVLDPGQAIPEFGASMSEVLTLRHLRDGPLTQQELGGRLGLEKSTVSRLVDSMLRREWVDKARDPDNRRYQLVALTPAGREAAARIGEAVHQRHARWFEALAGEELEALAVGLGALVRAIREDDATGGAERPAQ